MILNDNLINEQKILLLTGKLTMSEEDDRQLHEIMEHKIDWYYILNSALKNKILPLVWYNLRIKSCLKFMPVKIEMLFHFYYMGNTEVNKIYLNEFDKVSTFLYKKGITCIPLKGAHLIPAVYKDYGIRIISDIDCLILKKDTEEIIATMKELGYIQGEYDFETNSIKPLSRQEYILWKTKMNNLYPFKKICDSDVLKYFEFDFCFSLDMDLDTQPVKEMISRAVSANDGYKLYSCDFLLHLCAHLYKEARNVIFVIAGKDMIIIKFVDVREYVIHYMNEELLKETVVLAKKYNIEKALYFTMYHLDKIFHDGYEAGVLNQLPDLENEILDTYGERDYIEAKKWKKSFWDRIFDLTNEDEITEPPPILKIKKDFSM